jgi:hypothetical protein
MRKSLKKSNPSTPIALESLEARRLLTTLLDGHTVNLYGTTLAGSPGLAGTVIYEHSTPFTAIGTDGVVRFQGTLNEQVVRESNRKGTLDFYHSVVSDPTSGNTYDADTERFFSGFKTDVDYRIDSTGTVTPAYASRTADGNGVSFKSFGSLRYGQETVWYFVRTDATQFDTNGSSSLLFGSVDYRTGRSYLGFATIPIAEPIATPRPTALSASVSVAVNQDPNTRAGAYGLIAGISDESLI